MKFSGRFASDPKPLSSSSRRGGGSVLRGEEFAVRVFLQKAKKLLSLLEIIDNENNLEKAINEYKPPIFWKDKPVLKKQLQLWSFENIINLICELNDIEIKIKKNNSQNLILMKNFIYEILDRKTNNSFL